MYSDEIEYERMTLGVYDRLSERITGRASVTIDLRSRAVFVEVEDHIGAGMAASVQEELRILFFGAAYKALDLSVEYAIMHSGEARPPSGWNFKEKQTRLQSGLSMFPPPFDARQDIWTRVERLFRNLEEARHCVIHRRAEVDPSGTLVVTDRAGNPCSPVTADEQDAFIRTSQTIVELLLAQAADAREWNRVAFYLDRLTAHHLEPILGGVAMTDIPTLRFEVSRDDAGSYYVDPARLRREMKERNAEFQIADLELMEPGSDKVLRTVRLETIGDDLYKLE